MVQANPLLFKVVAQVQKEWTSNTNATNSTTDVQLSPGSIDSLVQYHFNCLVFFSNNSCLLFEW